jgi:hypothetical protein
MRFQGMAESIWSDVVSNSKPNPGAGPCRLPLVGPEPRQQNASGGPRSISSSADEFLAGYSSIGLVATRARLRFAGTRRLTCILQSPRRNTTFLLCREGDISTLP